MRLVAEHDAPNAVLLTVCNIAGSQFCPAGTKDVLRNIALGTPVTLVRESDNSYDPYAVRVDVDGGKVGYIPGKSGNDENRLLAALLDRGCELTAVVRTKGDPESHIARLVTLGVYIEIP